MKKILVILPIDRDKAALSRIPNLKDDYDIHFLECKDFKYSQQCLNFDVKAYVKLAIQYVKDHQIDGIIYTHDMASLIAAVVCEQTGLKGPSLKSVFLACHKYYSRASDPSAIPFEALNINSPDIDKLKISYPCFVKAPCLMCSHLQFIVKDKTEMETVLSIMRSQLKPWSKMFLDFFKEYISKDEYPLASQEIVVVEALMQDYQQSVVEGWVDAKGTVHIWATSDIHYHELQRQSQNCYSMPSTVPTSLQSQMVSLATQTVMRHGITSGFFNVDIWHWSGKQPSRIIEINGRAASLYHLMHSSCFDVSLYKAMIHLCLGQDDECYKESPACKSSLKQPIFGGLFFVVTFGKGKASNFLDFTKIEKLKSDKKVIGLELFVEPDMIITDNGTAGFRMAKFYLFGNSFEEINACATKYRREIIKGEEHSPYMSIFKNRTEVVSSTEKACQP